MGSQFMVTVFPGGFSPGVHYDPKGKSLCEEWIDHKQCRRITLSSYMDGQALTCQSSNVPECDLCEARIPKKRVIDAALPDNTEHSQPQGNVVPTSRITKVKATWYKEVPASHRLFHQYRAAQPHEQDSVIAENEIRLWQDFSSALKRLIGKVCMSKGELEGDNSVVFYCPLCAGLGQLRSHRIEECQKVPLDHIDDWLDALENLKSGVCKVCWLPIYHMDDGAFHFNVERGACRFREPSPFVPYFLYSLVWYHSNRKGKQKDFWGDEGIEGMIPEMLRDGGFVRRWPRRQGLLEWFTVGVNPYAVPLGWKALVHCLVILLGDDWERRKIGRRQNVELVSN